MSSSAPASDAAPPPSYRGASFSDRARQYPWLEPLLFVLLTIAVLFARRPDQFLHPYIWVEDGKYVLPHFIRDPWTIVTEPIAGYYIVVSKIIAFLAYTISFRWAPEIEVALVTALTCAVTLAIAYSPTRLPYPKLCALVPLFIPSGAENYAIGLYAFWWAGLLLFLAVLWDKDRGRKGLQLFYIIFAGFSCPLIGPVAITMALRAVLERTRFNAIIAAVSVTIAAIQTYAFYFIYHLELKAPPNIWKLARTMMKQFIGAFFAKESTLVIAEIIIVALALIVWFNRKRLELNFLLLLVLFALNCWMVSQRMTLETLGLIDPLGPGQRYFFYPYILFGWILIWVAYLSNQAAVRGVIALALIWAVVGHAGTALSRRNDVFSWREQVQICTQSENYDLPIHYDGSGKEMWSINLTGAECRSMIEKSWIR